MRAADGDRPGLSAGRAGAGPDRLDARRAAVRASAARRRGRRCRARSVRARARRRCRAAAAPPVTSARLTVNSSRPATNSLVPSSGSIRKKLSSIRQLRQLNALLGQRRDVRGQPREAFADDAVGGEIGFRHRRSVGLAVDLHGGAVDGQDGGAGPDHQIGQRLDQGGGGLAIDPVRNCLIHKRRSFAVRVPFAARPPVLAARACAVYQASRACVIRKRPPGLGTARLSRKI